MPKIHQGQVKVYCCFLSIYKQTWHFLELRKGLTQNDAFSSWHGQVPSYFAQNWLVFHISIDSTNHSPLPLFLCWIIFPKMFRAKKTPKLHDLVDWSGRRCHPWAIPPPHNVVLLPGASAVLPGKRPFLGEEEEGLDFTNTITRTCLFLGIDIRIIEYSILIFRSDVVLIVFFISMYQILV